MIYHVSLGTNDADRAAHFYDPVLAVIGMSRQSMEHGSIGYGSPAHEYLFCLEKPTDGQRATVGNGVHIAFAAAHRDVVDRFTGWRSRVAAPTPARPGCGPDTTAITTAPLCAIQTATRSRL